MPFLLFLLLFLFPENIALAVETEVGEVTSFGEYVSQIWAWATQVIFGVAVIMLIVGGILYMAARGEEERIENAKQVVKGAIVSMMLMLFSGVLFAVLQKPTADVDGAATLNDATFVLSNISTILLTMVGGISVIALITSGIQYMLSAGDLEKLETAKSGLKYSVIGLALSLTAYAVVQVVLQVWS
jgi:glucose uptake protein GlcU